MNAIVATPVSFVPAPVGLTADLPLPWPPRQAFITPADLGVGESATPAGGRRVRTPVPQVIRSEKLPDGHYVCMQVLEAASLLNLVCDTSLVRIVPRGHVLLRPDGDGWAHFIPDAVALHRNGSVEAFSFTLSWERDKAAEHGLRRAYRACGVGYSVLTERQRSFQPMGRANRLAMLHGRVEEARRGNVAKVRAALDRLGLPTTVEKVRRRARFPAQGGLGRTLPCLFELARAGEVALDLDRPIDGAASVRRGPFA